MQSIQPGDMAPEVQLTSHSGQPISLSSLRGKNAVVLFFYPKDGTPFCTREACGFRDAYETFAAAGAVVIGVSADSIESHQTFAATHRLPFLLASDADGAARRAFGVPKTLGFLPGRVTYVIDRDGVVRYVFNSQMNVAGHITEAIRVLRELAG